MQIRRLAPEAEDYRSQRRARRSACALLAASLCWASPAWAQEYGDDDTTSNPTASEVQRDREEDEKKKKEGDKPEEEDDRLRWSMRLTTEFHSSDNQDFREREEATDFDIVYTDDRETFGYTSLAAGLEYDAFENTTFALSASHSALWGGDQIGNTNAFGSFLFVPRLYVDWTAVNYNGFKLKARMGRQPFEIGGAVRGKDYMLRDIIDGAVVTADFGIGGAFRILALDLFVAGGRPDDINFARFQSTGQQNVLNFRGDTNTMRYGAIYENDKLPAGLQARAYGFYADLGAFGSGADRVYQGALGNFPDNDWNALFGARLSYQLERPDGLEINAHGDFAYSLGLDRKDTQAQLYDVDANGMAFGLAAEATVPLGALELKPRGEFFFAEGPRYTGGEGVLFNHGFVGFKGDQIGGLNQNRYGGWHPSAYIGFRNLENTPQDQIRKSGTTVAGGGVGALLLKTVQLDLDAWWFKDNGLSNLANKGDEEVQRQIDEIQAGNQPFGYSPADLEAQKRLGKSLGIELNTRVTYFAKDSLSFYMLGGLFLPGEFYKTEIPLNGGTALGSPNPQNFWAVVGGMTFKL